MTEEWRWQEVHASRAAAESAAVEILEMKELREDFIDPLRYPLRWLRAVRGKRRHKGWRFDLKFLIHAPFIPEPFPALVRIDLANPRHLWEPLWAFLITKIPGAPQRYWQIHSVQGQLLVETPEEIGYLGFYDNHHELLLSDPLPVGFEV